jgi:hypothetical protein
MATEVRVFLSPKPHDKPQPDVSLCPPPIPMYKEWKRSVDKLMAEACLAASAVASEVKRGGISAKQAYANGYSPEKYIRTIQGEALRHQEACANRLPDYTYMKADSSLGELLSPKLDHRGVIRRKIQYDKFWSARHRTVISTTYADRPAERLVVSPEHVVGALKRIAKNVRSIVKCYIANETRDDADTARRSGERIVATFYN